MVKHGKGQPRPARAFFLHSKNIKPYEPSVSTQVSDIYQKHKGNRDL